MNVYLRVIKPFDNVCFLLNKFTHCCIFAFLVCPNYVTQLSIISWAVDMSHCISSTDAISKLAICASIVMPLSLQISLYVQVESKWHCQNSESWSLQKQPVDHGQNIGLILAYRTSHVRLPSYLTIYEYMFTGSVNLVSLTTFTTQLWATWRAHNRYWGITPHHRLLPTDSGVLFHIGCYICYL